MVVKTDPLFISKYKPYYIREFCSSDQFKSVLETLMKIDDLNVLITGSACSGKTSLLYAIIRDYYGIEKHKGFPENNILFVNSLKEQGIGYYRNEMKTFSQSRCSIHGKKKLIVVDDLDMVNEQCQQVFRNYIDKYKSNIHFISVCSNVQKVIESIQSRVHILHIPKPTMDQIHEVQMNIISAEKMNISPEAQTHILYSCNHSIRELITMLEKIWLLSDGIQTLSLDVCKSIVSSISSDQFEQYIAHLKNNELYAATRSLHLIHDYGYSVIDIFDSFFSFVKNTRALDEDEKYKLLPPLCEYISYFHNIHEDEIELALFTHTILPLFQTNRIH